MDQIAQGLFKATKSARQLTVSNNDDSPTDPQTCEIIQNSSSQATDANNESIQCIIEHDVLWSELQKELRSSKVLTNACLQEAVQQFVEKKEDQLKRLKRKKQMPFRRMHSDSIIGRRFSPAHERRLAQEEEEKNHRSSSLDTTNTRVVNSGSDYSAIRENDDDEVSSVSGENQEQTADKFDSFAVAASISAMKDLPVFPLPSISALKSMLRSTSKEVEMQKEAEAAAAAKKENLVEFRERIHRRLSMEKLDEKMATIKLALAPATLSEAAAIDSDDDSYDCGNGQWRSDYERSLYMKSLLTVAEFESSKSLSSFGSSQASSRWNSEEDDDDDKKNNKKETIHEDENDEDDLICDFPSEPRRTKTRKFVQDHAFAA
mmetsp:Transcript_18448/g.26020  ORF Transcript_18448/g.26020 Transcript_18448/m.26020 type:complete len:376 (-) Transcript_18448:123-1250(-)